MACQKVYFRIRTECYSSGWSSDADRAAFKEESRRLFQELGWTATLGYNGGCDTVTMGQQDVELFPGKVSTIVLENHKHPNLIVYKNDADTGEPVEHTIFTVRAADGHSVDEIETDSTGRAELKNLLPGVYEISEKSVPSPWLKDAPSQLVTL